MLYAVVKQSVCRRYALQRTLEPGTGTRCPSPPPSLESRMIAALLLPPLPVPEFLVALSKNKSSKLREGSKRNSTQQKKKHNYVHSAPRDKTKHNPLNL